MKCKAKNPTKRRVGRPIKDKCVESIPDTPENVAKALFGIKSNCSYINTATKKSKT